MPDYSGGLVFYTEESEGDRNVEENNYSIEEFTANIVSSLVSNLDKGSGLDESGSGLEGNVMSTAGSLERGSGLDKLSGLQRGPDMESGSGQTTVANVVAADGKVVTTAGSLERGVDKVSGLQRGPDMASGSGLTTVANVVAPDGKVVTTVGSLERGSGLDKVLGLQRGPDMASGSGLTTVANVVATDGKVVTTAGSLECLDSVSGATTAGNEVTAAFSLVTSAGTQECRDGTPAKKGYTCPFCGVQGIATPSKLRLHIDRLHSSPIICKMCDVTFVDKYFFNLHYTNCYYICPNPQCDFHDKRKERLIGHMHHTHNVIM